jgi:ParB family chromosome partitioning protein
VRQTEALVQNSGEAKKSSGKASVSKDADTRAAEEELKEVLGLKVELRPGKGEKGELRIRYSTLEQLEDVRERLMRGLNR